MVVFFFFQAEDGIRDGHVTGVQTCALPISAELGIGKLKRANPEFVREHTGQTIGGVAPVGHPQPVRTLVDTTLQDYDEVWAAGGIAHAVFPTTYDELLSMTNGTPVTV